MMADTVRIGVIGTGALGKEHARLCAQMAREGLVRFTGVHDTSESAGRTCAERHQVQFFPSLEAAADANDALVLVTPTHTHFQLATVLLQRRKHLLVEKPMTQTAAEAEDLIHLAHTQGSVLQVGHVERFNPVFQYLGTVAGQPRFIESHRLSPYPARSIDIGVVLDLMIHDLDVVLAFVGSPVISVDAVGIPVLSPSEDIANARVRFANGCIANLTASRVSPERMRKIRVFSAGPNPSYISLDYRAQEGYVYRLAGENETGSSLWKKLVAAKKATIVSEFGGKRIVREPVPVEKDEPLRLELRSFIHCIEVRQAPVVSGESAKLALDLALEITRQITHASPPAP